MADFDGPLQNFVGSPIICSYHQIFRNGCFEPATTICHSKGFKEKVLGRQFPFGFGNQRIGESDRQEQINKGIDPTQGIANAGQLPIYN